MNAFCVTRCMKYESLKYNQALSSGGVLQKKKKNFVIQGFALNNPVF